MLRRCCHSVKSAWTRGKSNGLDCSRSAHCAWSLKTRAPTLSLIDCRKRSDEMTGSIYRAATPADISTIIEFQIAMARETEDLGLDREIVGKGVAAVFENAALGRYYVAENDGCVIASLLITYEWSDWRNGTVWW